MSRRVWNDNRSQGNANARSYGDKWSTGEGVPPGGGVFDRLGRPPQQQHSESRPQQNYDSRLRRGGGGGTGGGGQYASNYQAQGRSESNYNPRGGGQGGYGQRGGGGGGNQNRFAALGNDDGERRGQSGRQRSQNHREDGGQLPSRLDWRQVVRHDSQTEQPRWPFTCYAHERDGPNDLEGDVSFEELRWAQQQAVLQGTNPATLMNPFDKAVAHRQQQIQAMLKGNRPPSQGGPCLPPFQPPILNQQFPASPATPFGQVVSAFGAGPAGRPSTGGFGVQAAPAFGQAGGFGGANPTFGTGGNGFQRPAFGNALGPQASVFGASPRFDSPAANPFVTSSFGTNQGVTNATGERLDPSRSCDAPALTQMGVPGGLGPQPEKPAIYDHSANPWESTHFVRGHIPEEPPPAMYCH